MAARAPQASARALLFDRLVDRATREPTEPQPKSTLTRAELHESVRREVEWLLNTRCPVPADHLDPRERSVIDYGVPDGATSSPHSQADRQRLATVLRHTITAFEPRLRQVRVLVAECVEAHKPLQVRIEAVLVVAAISDPIAFSVVVQGDRGGAEVHASA
jgi:type VI secretion system protein ImpF